MRTPKRFWMYGMSLCTACGILLFALTAAAELPSWGYRQHGENPGLGGNGNEYIYPEDRPDGTFWFWTVGPWSTRGGTNSCSIFHDTLKYGIDRGARYPPCGGWTYESGFEEWTPVPVALEIFWTNSLDNAPVLNDGLKPEFPPGSPAYATDGLEWKWIPFQPPSTNKNAESTDEKALSKEPINAVDGNMKRDATDLIIPCPAFNLEFSRHYSSVSPPA